MSNLFHSDKIIFGIIPSDTFNKKSRPIVLNILLRNSILSGLIILFSACQQRTETTALDSTREVKGHFVAFSDLDAWEREDHDAVLTLFREQCGAPKMADVLRPLCPSAEQAQDAKAFFEANFVPFMLKGEAGEEVLLTGYYEPEFDGSLQAGDDYPYPLYKRPEDLLVVDSGRVYDDLKHYKLRGRLAGSRVVPYYSRQEINGGAIKEAPLCYMKSDVDRFFLQVQGSGRVVLEDNSTMLVGYDGENGHPYRSIGKALVASGAIDQEKISLASIRRWLKAHPQEAKGVLESNPSFVFFDRRQRAASGAMGMELTPLRSVAVDRSKIPLGYPLFLSAANPVTGEKMERMVLAQDTGGAIKGQVRADLFCGHGKEAEKLAGALRSPLKLYVLVPKITSTSSSIR